MYKEICQKKSPPCVINSFMFTSDIFPKCLGSCFRTTRCVIWQRTVWISKHQCSFTALPHIQLYTFTPSSNTALGGHWAAPVGNGGYVLWWRAPHRKSSVRSSHLKIIFTGSRIQKHGLANNLIQDFLAHFILHSLLQTIRGEIWFGIFNGKEVWPRLCGNVVVYRFCLKPPTIPAHLFPQ